MMLVIRLKIIRGTVTRIRVDISASYYANMKKCVFLDHFNSTRISKCVL